MSFPVADIFKREPEEKSWKMAHFIKNRLENQSRNVKMPWMKTGEYKIGDEAEMCRRGGGWGGGGGADGNLWGGEMR